MTAARAVLSAHSGSSLVTLEQLSKFSTPAPTKTWSPIPHAKVPELISTIVAERGWSITPNDDGSRFQLSVTSDGGKMFGVAKLVIPKVLDVAIEPDFGMALGFRNSHDKSIALQIVAGTNVFVCDNLMMKGEIRVRREHTSGINIYHELERIFELIPGAAVHLTDWFGSLRNRLMARDEGVSFLAYCVERGALPIADFMGARSSFLASFEQQDGAAIRHGGTMWAAYQAVTEQWKKHSLLQLPGRSAALGAVVDEVRAVAG